MKNCKKKIEKNIISYKSNGEEVSFPRKVHGNDMVQNCVDNDFIATKRWEKIYQLDFSRKN